MEDPRSGMCGAELATMEPMSRVGIMEQLLVQRFLRKCERVRDIWESSARDWNQTLYTMTAYAMGAPYNSRPFEELSRRVDYLMCLRERSSLRRVEAMLLGASGLLRGEHYNHRGVGLQEEFDYLAGKYGLRVMRDVEWNVRHHYPSGSPIVRVVQLAALVTRDSYSVDALLGACSLEDVERLFEVAEQSCWLNELLPTKDGSERNLRLGKDKVWMLAINMVAPMQFAYGEVMKNDDLKARAFALLEAIPAERNRLVSRWTGEGVEAENAGDSQALIELAHLCDEGRCSECPLGRFLERSRTKI